MINAIGNAILTSSLVGAVSSGAEVITDGLKLWLPLKDYTRTASTQTTPDISGNSNDADLLTARYLNLNSDSTKNNSVDFNGTMSGSKGSFALWFRRDATWGTTTSNHLVDITATDGSERLIIAFQQSQGYKLNVYSKNGGSAAWGDDPFVTVSDDVWYRLVVTIDGTTLKCYLNGVQVGNTATLSEGLDIGNAKENYLASSDGGANSHFIGNMSDFQMWNEVWSDADVLFDYDNPNELVINNPTTSLVDTNLKVWLPLNEGGGDFCIDNGTSRATSAYGKIETDGQTISDLWEVGQSAPSPQPAMQNFNIGNNELIETFNSDVLEWIKDNITIATESTESPAQGYRSQKVTRTASGACLLKQNYTTDTAGDVCVSVYIKSGSFTQADAITSLALRKDSARTLWGMNYDWSTGTTSVRSGSPSINNMTATDVGDGWYRLSFSVGGFSVSDALIYELYPDIENSTTGDGVYVFGPQLEYGENPTAVRLNGEEYSRDNTIYTSYYKTNLKDALNTALRSRENSYNADGRGYSIVTTTSDLDFGTGAFTMECWVKAGYTKQSSVLNTIFCLGNAVSATDSGGITTHENGKFIGYVAGQTMSSDSTWTKGNWYHVVVTRNGSGVCTLYVDTTAQADTETTTDTVTNTGNATIGRDSNSNRYYANLISDVRCYDVALTQEQIQENYDAGTAAHSN